MNKLLEFIKYNAKSFLCKKDVGEIQVDPEIENIVEIFIEVFDFNDWYIENIVINVIYTVLYDKDLIKKLAEKYGFIK